MLLPGKIKLAIGLVVKTHGIKGELNFELNDFARPEEDLAPGACVIAEIDGLDVPFFVSSTRPRGAQSVLLTLDEVADEKQASELVGKVLYIYSDPLTADGNEELTAGDLIGFDISDADSGQTVGRIDDIVELTAGSWYFRLKDSGKLIPAVDEMIIEIDDANRTVVMELPEGLLEL